MAVISYFYDIYNNDAAAPDRIRNARESVISVAVFLHCCTHLFLLSAVPSTVTLSLSPSLAPQQHILISPVSDCHIFETFLQHTFYIRVVDSVVARRKFLGLHFLDSISITRSSAAHSY